MTSIFFFPLPYKLTLKRVQNIYIQYIHMCVSDKNHHSNFLRSSAKRQSFPEVDMIKESERERETMDKGSERGEWNLAREQGERGRKPPCGWQWIFLPGNFPPPSLSKHFTYHYVNLIKRRGWVKVLGRNAAPCVYILRLLWSKWNA